MYAACRSSEKSVLATAKRVWGLYVIFDYRNACMWLVAARIVRFGYRKFLQVHFATCRNCESLFCLPQSVYETCRSSESPYRLPQKV